MPELPEVETVKRILEPQLQGQTIVNATVNHPQIIAHSEAESFRNKLAGQTIKGLSRRGKYLTIHFESDDSLTLHLRMTGQLLVTPPDYPEEKHTHLIVKLNGGNELRYIDVRRFGRFWFLDASETDTVTGIHKLGKEPAEITSDYIIEKLSKRKKPIKEMLHEQSVIAGIGNIYSLYRGSIPRRSAVS